MKTGEIWLAQLDPTVGSEIQKTRPCVVVSPDEMNAHLRTVIVAPMTTGSRPAAFRVPLTFQGKRGLIVLDQIRTLDRARLVKRLGVLRAPTLASTRWCWIDRGSQRTTRRSSEPSTRSAAGSKSSASACVMRWRVMKWRRLTLSVTRQCQSSMMSCMHEDYRGAVTVM